MNKKSFDHKVLVWRVAYFSQEVKDKIAKRDDYECVWCWSSYMIDFHHVLFWSETKRDTDRNTEKNGVAVCRSCHTKIHWCRRWEWIRQQCIDYLSEKY